MDHETEKRGFRTFFEKKFCPGITKLAAVIFIGSIIYTILHEMPFAYIVPGIYILCALANEVYFLMKKRYLIAVLILAALVGYLYLILHYSRFVL